MSRDPFIVLGAAIVAVGVLFTVAVCSALVMIVAGC